MSGRPAPPRRSAPWRRALRLTAIAVIGLWCAGFLWYLAAAFAPAPPLPARAGGIVVLTGGTDRVRTALGLLARRIAPRLLISGVGPDVTFAEIAHLAGYRAAPLEERVSLGFDAHSTLGNARETAAWAAAHRLRSLIVVTADYHMPRALAEMAAAMPTVRLYPLPVDPPTLARLPRLRLARLLVTEYVKLVLARLGLTRPATRLLAWLER